MNKRKYLIFTLILSLLCMNKTYAACTQDEIKEFKRIQNEYKITTEFNRDDKTYKMTIERPNTKKYDYVFTIDYEYNCQEINETTTECTGLKPGTSFEAKIIGLTNSCTDVLKDTTIKLENYNKYYGDPLCEGIEEFVLCQEMYDKEIDYDTFVSRVNTYKKTKQEQLEEQYNENENNTKIDEVTTYIEENLIQIVIIVIFIILVIISTIVMIKSTKKSRRLE